MATVGIRHHATSTAFPCFCRFTVRVRNPEKETDPGGPCHPSSLNPGSHQPDICWEETKSLTLHMPCAVTVPSEFLTVYVPPPTARRLLGSQAPFPERASVSPFRFLANG